MRTKYFLKVVLLFICLTLFCESVDDVTFIQKENQIDVLFNNTHFTTYLYTSDLTKPILFPVYSPSGICMNRSYPFQEVDGESHDHPHHTGLFFTYDKVNNDGFWNNTSSPPQIRHKTTTQMTGGESGVLSVLHHWIGSNNKIVLEENRTMIFQPGKDEHTIDFTITLTAKDTTVIFHDTKEGMFAIRVAPWLKEKGGSGRYLSSNGDETEQHIWGKRASWVILEGKNQDKIAGIAMLNHPQSTNYPTFWHIRGYGLFAANPLGQSVFQKSHKIETPQELNLTLKPNKSVLFKFKLIIYEGHRTKEQWDRQFEDYTGS